MDHHEHIVEFDKYCKLCKHWDEPAFEDPCNECLTQTVRLDSRKPEKFEEAGVEKDK